MAQRKIAGKNMFLFMGRAANNLNQVICLTSQTYTRTTDEIDAATQCGPDTQPGPQKNSYSFEGQTMLDPDGGKISTDEIDDFWRNGDTIFWKVQELAPTIGSIIYSGSGFISELTENFALNEPSTFTGKIGIYGLASKSTATS